MTGHMHLPVPIQYGGIKNCSVNHLLIDLYEEVLSALDEGKSAVIVGVDFEKAFNRLDHGECLAQLQALGASSTSIALTRAFLTDRKMRIKIDGNLSEPKTLRGGSPQGSILGCFLYCITTQQINNSLVPPLDYTAPRRPGPEPPPNPLLDSPGLADGGMSLMPEELDDGPSDDSFTTAPGSPADPAADSHEDQGQQSDDLRPGTTTMVKYIDDTTLVETTDQQPIRHIAGDSPTETICPVGVERTMTNLVARAEDIGMRVNKQKTQMICISRNNGYKTTAILQVGEERIQCSDHMKLLGFNLDASGTVEQHVRLLREKFRARFWSLIHLRRAGIRSTRLFKLYAALIRPVLEANSVVYHPMLGVGQSNELERMQKQVTRLCFGFDKHYAEVLEEQEIRTLKERRVIAARKFVAKTIANNPRFANKWFARRPGVQADIRSRRPYIEKRARSERYRNSPLLYLQRIANDMATERPT